MNEALNIQNYIADGFVKVCEVILLKDNTWIYKNINDSVMYKDHRSWIYFIVSDNEIVKVGETGNPLGIKSTRYYIDENQHSWYQPTPGSTNRFGRYRKGDLTDEFIRNSLKNEAILGKVSLWAKECPLQEIEVTIRGEKTITKNSIHKHLELDILKNIRDHGSWPRLNKALK